jgi:nitroimidazol reductase NimA-like FMN-containing flavoprotein (pyridoxamine 5'-phosphate oxidase superfamily)
MTTIRALDRHECLAILERNNVGRLAFTFRDRVDVVPINYAMLDGDLVFRTGPGSKLDVMKHHPWVAFEVDEVDGYLEWRSAVVHGTMYHLQPVGVPEEVESYHRAVERLRTLLPPEKREEDPLAERPVALRLHVDHITGREATNAPK